MISEFENAVLREPSRVPVPGSTIHPLTKYVMNYISLISDYKQTLGALIISKPTTGSRHCDSTAPDMDFTDHEGQSTLKETDVEAACASATHPTADVFINFASYRSHSDNNLVELETKTEEVDQAVLLEGGFTKSASLKQHATSIKANLIRFVTMEGSFFAWEPNNLESNVKI
ncbi:hypothetical protein L1987_64108 [Smallanthus sonchifolius]|uniref:Uncharacterized protein n=1 Tax=Smallanthus sonchifolius TaxID=185202 RepID=A0ACB9CF64_9ASTR|nr:hypothetical protein L1987_64108 [Smallanthus sonchifolius]